jgi:single-stranded DNA-binding protein
MYGNTLVIEGNLTKDPVLRSNQFGPSVTFAIAHNHKSQQGTESTQFVNCVANGPLAVNLEKSLRKGDAVIVVGSVSNYPTRDGNTMVGLKVEFAGPSLTFATAEVTRNPRGSYNRDDFIVMDSDEEDEEGDEDDEEPAPRGNRARKAEKPAPRRRATGDMGDVLVVVDTVAEEPAPRRRATGSRVNTSSKPKSRAAAFDEDDDDFDDGDIDL